MSYLHQRSVKTEDSKVYTTTWTTTTLFVLVDSETTGAYGPETIFFVRELAVVASNKQVLESYPASYLIQQFSVSGCMFIGVVLYQL